MKTKIVLLLSLFLLISALRAQPGNWLLAGNLLFGNEKFGSTNAIPLNFYTNNTQKMQLDVTGNLGIGGIPNNRLDVFAGDIDVNAPRRSYMINDKSILWHKGNVSNLFVGVGAGQNHLFNSNARNTFLGNNAGFLATGIIGPPYNMDNVLIGTNAGYNLSQGSNVTIIGSDAGFNNNADHATFIGYRAGYTYNQPSGGQTGNTFVGYESGYSNLGNVNDNSFFGHLSGFSNTTGDQNSFFGTASGQLSTTGGLNSFFGNASGQQNGIHFANCYFGHVAGNTSTGDENIFIGAFSGMQGVGNKNIVIGNNGMSNATTASNENVYIGYQTGLSGNTNDFNTILGSQSAINLANSKLNTLVGYKTALNQTSGSENTYVGESTGNNVQSGTNNTFIGAKADATNVTPMLNNAAAIGANAQVTNDNHMILGDNNVNVGIGLSGDPTGPGNKLEINTAATSAIPGASGLRFTDLNSTSTAGTNPGTGVLSVDALGDVIYVQTTSTGGSNIGNNCGSTPNPLISDYEIPLGTTTPQVYNYYFTGQDLTKEKVSVGFPCGTVLRGRFNSYQNFGPIINQKTISGYFLNSDVNNQNQDSLVGVFGEANGIQPFGIDNTNIGGSFYGLNARTNIGVQGIAQNTPFQPTPPADCYGGRFVARNGNTNYGVWATAPNIANSFAGYFNGDVMVNGGLNSGSGFLVASDQMFKINTDTIANASTIIKQLKPKTYYYDTTNIYNIRFSSKKQYGLIAQEVETILPELVSNISKPAEKDSTGNIIAPSVNYKNLNYNAFIAILIKGMQIQQRVNEKQDSIIGILTTQISNLTSSVSSCCSSTAVRTTKPEELNQLNIDLNDKDAVVLNQNTPNPFAEQTTITYNVPEKFGYAQMIFSTIDGRILKTVDITKKGRGQINVYASDLSSGMYTYSLNVDGKIFETKKMIKSE